jgi:nicotinate-nucleotide--dimethylbenzimidazole phosphoribosyltransferase
MHILLHNFRINAFAGSVCNNCIAGICCFWSKSHCSISANILNVLSFTKYKFVLQHLASSLQQKMDQKAKPIGALGKLENIAVQLGLVQQTLTPAISKPHIVVFAADHGIAATGLVNPYPQEVTAQMVLNFVQGGAAINVLCRQHHIDLTVVDAGVATPFNKDLPIEHQKIRSGTFNYLNGPAMEKGEATVAMERGKAIVNKIFTHGCNTIGMGEMGIGNSSSAALLMHYYTQLSLESCIGNGTGATQEKLTRKFETLQQAATHHQLLLRAYSAPQLLETIGGYEIAMMAGAYVQAYQNNMVIVVDGFISTAALLCAHHLCPEILTHCVFAHCSHEQGHKAILQHLKAEPLLQLDMRLGEGTGAALAIPLLRSAAALLHEMASFESAGVSNKL